MNLNYLEFEEPIAELDEKIAELRRVGVGHDINLSDEITKLERSRDALYSEIFSDLTPHQIVQMARHPARPYTLDYINEMFTDFQELQGDRHNHKGKAIIGGFAKLAGQPVMIIGQQKGRNTKDKIARNFGMSTPEDFRKALRLMKLAEKFDLPVLTFIDTMGAYPGLDAEKRNQSEAIARNLFEMSELKVPVICTVIGEGCSGGALAIGVGDRVLMLQYAYYSVISPEGCASILWKSAEKAPQAAEALRLTAKDLHEHKLIDYIIEEPLGGAHRDLSQTAAALKTVLCQELAVLKSLSTEELLAQRYDRLTAVGRA